MSDVAHALLGGIFALGLFYVGDRGVFYQVCLLMSIPENVEPQLVWKSGKNSVFEPAKVLLAVIASLAFVGVQLWAAPMLIATSAVSFLAFFAVSWKRAYDTFKQVTGYPD